jgi:HPt (histidine-containing phosphotransfer) domain-containing protein
VREAAAIAHKLKSSSRSIGALPLGDVCAEIEATASKGEAETLERLGTQFDICYRRAIEVVRSLTPAAQAEPRV